MGRFLKVERKIIVGQHRTPDRCNTDGSPANAQLVYYFRHQTVDDAMALMTDKRVRHLPVVEDGRVVGLISIGDAVKATISHQQFVIEQLETYISS